MEDEGRKKVRIEHSPLEHERGQAAREGGKSVGTRKVGH